MLDADFAIIAASASFQQAFDLAQTNLSGQSLYALSAGAWDLPELRLLLDQAVSGAPHADNCELDLTLPLRASPRHVLVQARRLEYLDLEQSRILVALSDVTEAKADAAVKDEEARHNVVLLQEVRHRVANSLQIIASVLLQNARKTPSEETRGHLKDAHHRVMSVAALERLLSTSQEGEVDVHAYFTSLCESITASMIGEADNVMLTVDGGDGVIDARVSLSLGLIITELVINALKYAFPDGRPGKIAVDYNFHGPNWILCVRDNGVGMPETPPARTGLGTSIVQALARQLQCSVMVFPEDPGTKVTIEHTQIALVHEELVAAPEPLATVRPKPTAVQRQVREDRS